MYACLLISCYATNFDILQTIFQWYTSSSGLSDLCFCLVWIAWKTCGVIRQDIGHSRGIFRTGYWSIFSGSAAAGYLKVINSEYISTEYSHDREIEGFATPCLDIELQAGEVVISSSRCEKTRSENTILVSPSQHLRTQIRSCLAPRGDGHLSLPVVAFLETRCQSSFDTPPTAFLGVL